MTRWYKSLIFVVIGLFIFLAARVALFLVYKDFFSFLSTKQVIISFLIGIRFDLSILLVVFSLPLALYNIPIRLADSKLWQELWGWTMYGLLLLLTFILISDIIYFEQVKRHLINELLLLGNDVGYVFEVALRSYKTQLSIFFLFAFFLALIWRWIITRPTLQSPYISLKFLLFAGVMVFCIRGGFSGKPIGIIDAFESGSSTQSNLVLSGAFTLFHNLQGKKNVNHHFFAPEEAQQIVRTPLENPGSEIQRLKTSEGLISHLEGKIKNPYNVVFVVLESWSPFYIDSFGHNSFGVTPNFDRLASEGLQFTNFYAVGQRSIEGIQAVLTGLPPIIGLPAIGFGLETSNFPKIGNVLKSHGYETIFIQTSKRRSFRMDAVARATGFDSYYGMEDIPMLIDYSGQKSSYGWDYEALMFMKSRLDPIKKPFFAFLFTGTTHMPYINPGKDHVRYTHDQNGENGFLNTLHYSDWSLGQFMEAAAKSAWFEDTIFIFTADHNLNAYRSFDYAERFHTPLIIYAPKLFGHRTIEHIGSQADIPPTILDMLGMKDRFATIGMSLFQKDDEFAYLCDKISIGIVSPRAYLSHSLSNRLESGFLHDNSGVDYLNRLERKLLALNQVMYDMITNNKWER